jgi:hypothetical protein
VNASRDEQVWRAAYSKGTNPRYNSVIAALTSWETTVLNLLKTVIHWLFGLGISVYINNGMVMRPPQIFHLTAVAGILALITTYIATRRLSGPQPATYGQLQTLIDLVDLWPGKGERMYWGHKREREDQICHA